METAEYPTLTTRGPQRWVLDRYRLVRRLGAGGFGVVWLAHDEHLDRAVAVKRVAIVDDDPARAEREALASARLQHPGIVALYESGRDDEAVYLVSELVRGRTFAQLTADGELSDRDVLAIGMALCDALAHAHKRGVVHRDVKPSNVLVPDMPHDGAGVAKLTDFGVARMLGDDALTRTGDVVGTLAYMAPEQAEGRPATEASDLYSLALVLYEGLAGDNPVRGRGMASTARRLGARMPSLQRLRRDLPPDLCRALDTALLPRPEQRGDLRRLRTALTHALDEVDDEPGTVATPALPVALTRARIQPAPAPRAAAGRDRRAGRRGRRRGRSHLRRAELARRRGDGAPRARGGAGRGRRRDRAAPRLAARGAGDLPVAGRSGAGRRAAAGVRGDPDADPVVARPRARRCGSPCSRRCWARSVSPASIRRWPGRRAAPPTAPRSARSGCGGSCSPSS